MIEIDSSSNSRKNVSLYRKEREKKVLELYHVQGKTTRDIRRELSMSPNTITDILKRDREEKEREKEREKKEDSVYKVGDDNGGNGDARSRPMPQQAMIVSSQQQPITTTTTPITVRLTAAEAESLSPNERAAIAYRLYDEGMRTVDVAKILFLPAEETIRYYKEFWRLKHHDELYRIYLQIRHEIPYLLKFHTSLRNHGLTDSMEDIDHYVGMLDVVYKKLPEVEAELSDMQTKVEKARNELLATRQERREVLYEFRNEKRILDNDIQVAKKNILDLREAHRQMQQSFDTLLHKVNNATYRLNSIQQFVLKLKRTNKDYVKVKEVAEDHIRSVLTEEGIMKLLSIAVNSVVEALRQNPDMCANVVFNDNNNNNGSDGEDGDIVVSYGDPRISSIAVYNGGVARNTNASANNNTDEYQKGILMLAKNLFNTFMNQITNQTMNTLEAEETEDTEEEGL